MGRRHFFIIFCSFNLFLHWFGSSEHSNHRGHEVSGECFLGRRKGLSPLVPASSVRQQTFNSPPQIYSSILNPGPQVSCLSMPRMGHEANPPATRYGITDCFFFFSGCDKRRERRERTHPPGVFLWPNLPLGPPFLSLSLDVWNQLGRGGGFGVGDRLLGEGLPGRV